MPTSLDSYLERQYQIKLRPLTEEEGGGWLAEIPALPGCASDGETKEKALHNLEDAKRQWMRVALKRGLEIPPSDSVDDEFSGRLTLRLPKSLHRELAVMSTDEGVSLNQLILTILANGMGGVYDPEPAEEPTGAASGLARERVPRYYRRSRAPSRQKK